jgi:hypothetical protein
MILNRVGKQLTGDLIFQAKSQIRSYNHLLDETCCILSTATCQFSYNVLAVTTNARTLHIITAWNAVNFISN